jgi:hypothetical protein
MSYESNKQIVDIILGKLSPYLRLTRKGEYDGNIINALSMFVDKGDVTVHRVRRNIMLGAEMNVIKYNKMENLNIGEEAKKYFRKEGDKAKSVIENLESGKPFEYDGAVVPDIDGRWPSL